MHGSLARYETVWRDEPLETDAIDIPADAPFHFAKKLDFGRYRIEVLGRRRHGRDLACGSAPAGSSSDNPDVPDQVDVSADKQGLRARRHRPASTSPRRSAARPRCWCCPTACMCVRNLTVPAGGTDVDVPVSADWGPGAYVAVHVFRTAADAKSRPGRAIGLAWVGIDPGARKLPVAFDVPDKYPPRARAAIRAARGARRLGQPGGGGRGHPAADPLRLARSDRSLPRPPHVWASTSATTGAG